MQRQVAAARERQFQRGIAATPWYQEFLAQYGEHPDLNTKDYDYRKAWAAGVRPVRDPHDNNRYHWPSSLQSGEMLKSADHPTAWKEYFMRETGVNPDAMGLNKDQAQEYLLKQRRSILEQINPMLSPN